MMLRRCLMISGLSVRGCAVSEPGRNRTAVEATIKALTDHGKIAQVDEALVAIVRTLADAVDSDPLNASLWREFRAAQSDLRSLYEKDDDDFTALIKSLSAEVGDTAPPKPKKSRG